MGFGSGGEEASVWGVNLIREEDVGFEGVDILGII